MKLMNIDVNRLDELFDIINNCTGKVELVSEDGDCLNLKSKLTQYVSIAKIFSDGSDLINSLEIKVENNNDAMKLIDFMMGRI